MNTNNKNSSVKAALSTISEGSPDFYTLSTGVKVRLHSVGGQLINSAMAQIKDPPIPIVTDEQQGREYENPSDPTYLAALERATIDRGFARLDTIILWGVELVDGMPDDDTWLPKLKVMEKQGYIDLSGIDFENPIEKEFAYKKYIAIGDKVDKNGNVDMALISSRGTVSEGAIEEASGVFPGDETQAAYQERTAQESEVIPE